MVRVQYQLFSEETNRPFDYALNKQPIEDPSILPSEGDYIHFPETDEGLLKVKSRLFSYHYVGDEKHLMINIVVKYADKDLWPELIKE